MQGLTPYQPSPATPEQQLFPAQLPTALWPSACYYRVWNYCGPNSGQPSWLYSIQLSHTKKAAALPHWVAWPGSGVLPSVSDSQDIDVLLILFCLKPGYLCRAVEEISSKGSVGKLIVWLVGCRHQGFLLISRGPFWRLSTPNLNFWGLSQDLSSLLDDYFHPENRLVTYSAYYS